MTGRKMELIDENSDYRCGAWRKESITGEEQGHGSHSCQEAEEERKAVKQIKKISESNCQGMGNINQALVSNFSP